MTIDTIFSILDNILINPDRKAAYIDITHEYMNNGDLFRSTVNQLWDFGVTWVFPDGKRLASTVGETSLPEQRIQASLLYYSLDAQNSKDIRDDILGIANIYHSCIAAGLNPDLIFRSVANVSLPSVSRLLINFIERPDKQKCMEAFALAINDDGSGIFVKNSIVNFPLSKTDLQIIKGYNHEIK
jgi:hypothetical protein